MGWNGGGSTGGGGAVAPLTLSSGTITTSQPALTQTQTWNASGIVFKASVVNVTNTASAAGSLLADWQVGGSSVANIDLNGMITVRQGSYNNLAIQFGIGSGNGIYYGSSGFFLFSGGGSAGLLCSTINCNGGLQLKNNAASNKTANYTATVNDYLIPVDATSGAITITLPDATTGQTQAGSIYIIKKIDASANAVTVATTSSQTIDGATTYSLPARWNSLTVMSSGANWLITAKV